MTTLLEYFFDPTKLITLLGLVGVIAIVYVETGLLFGFFLPGDSLLITAGLFAARGDISIVILVLTTMLAAVLGDATGFYIGKKLGELLYSKDDSIFFKKRHITNAHNFYEKHGGKTIVIARFIPIIRTFVPTVAGAAQMTYMRFAFYNIIGAVLWVGLMCLSGYYLGRVLGSKINSYIHILVIGVIIVSFLPIVFHWIRNRKTLSEEQLKKSSS